MKIKDIIPNPNNPRIIKDDKFAKLVQSIKEFPEMLELRPIVIDEDNMVLGGNMRLKACIEAGLTDVPVKVATLTEEQKKEFIIKDNVSGGEWDWDILANEWEVEQLEEWGLDIPVNFEVELEAEEDDFEVPEGGTETDIVLGDLFEIGQHRLLCGDSTQTDTFDKLFNGQLADMVITDPPYNVAYEGKTKEALTIKNDKQGDKEFYQFLYDFYTAQATVCKMGGAWYVWHADSEGANFRQAMKDAGIMVKQCLIWVKNSMVMGRQDYQWKHEPCLYGWKEGAAHGWYSDRRQTTVINIDRPNRNGEHPTMKPIPLFSYQIGNSSKQGDIIADAFGGSGTTMVACHQMQRKAYMVEFDPKYCQVIIDRMKKLDPTLIIKKNGIQQS
jgi:site-specific DNA-methyltransferase (adenine-specific)